MKFENSSFAPSNAHVNSLNHHQLDLLFQVYEQLDVQFDFFMAQETHKSFMNLYHETFGKGQTDTFRSLVNILTSHTYENRYPHLLLAIDLIKKDYSLHTIINQVYQLR